MESFEDLGVAPEWVEALAAEGIERPTPLQEAAIPVLRRGNNVLLAAGPGSGLTVAWALPLLERVESQGPSVIVLTATADASDSLAESVARLTVVSGHTVAALGSPWCEPSRAQVVFGTPAEVHGRLASGELAPKSVLAFVLDQAQHFDPLGASADVEAVISFLPPEAQRVVCALPVTEQVSDLVERHCRRAVTIPPPETGSSPKRGRVRFRVTSESREAAALALAGELLGEEARHLLFFCRSEDRAADLADYMTLRGFRAGAPGDASLPVWVAVEALPARAAAEGTEGLVVVSCDVPPDPDTLDRRHGTGSDGVVIVTPRELVHLKSVGRTTGYEAVPFPPPGRRVADSIEQLRTAVERAIAEEDTAAYLVALEPLFERYDPAEVAAAAVALLRARTPAPPPPAPRAGGGSTDAPAWAKLFIGVGDRDGLRPGDLLGAITGEARVDAEAVGKIDIRESHSVVEVHDAVARAVIKSLNGTTIRGRAVRADFDRPRKNRAGAARTR